MELSAPRWVPPNGVLASATRQVFPRVLSRQGPLVKNSVRVVASSSGVGKHIAGVVVGCSVVASVIKRLNVA